MLIKRILKICDFYGTKFHWYIGYKPKYYSYFGGIFSILSFILWILIFIIFNLDDFKRKHPIVNTSTIPPNGNKNIKFGEQKLYLPWRIVDYDEKPIDHKGILYPKIYYFTSKYNNETGGMKTNYTLINYTLCNETSMKFVGKEFLLDISIEDLYCIDMEDLDIGGSWNSEFLNYIRFDLYLCKDGIDYNESNFNCTSYNKFNELHGKDNNFFFELLYPVVQFQPTEKKIPILILYKAYYYIFSRYSNKLDRIYLQEYVLEDEQGWIFNKYNNLSYWGTYSIGGENYITSDEDIVYKGSNSRLYSLKIYLNLGMTFYTRKYKKLYEMLSDIFPLIRAITIFFSFLAEIISELYSTKKLNEFIIGIDKKKKDLKKNKKSKILLNLNTLNNSNNLSKNINGKNNKLEEKNNKNQFSKILEDSSKLFCIPSSNYKQIVPDKKISTNSMGLNLKKGFNINYSPKSNNRNKIHYFDNFEKIKFPLLYYFFGIFLIKLKSRKFKSIYISEKFSKSFIFYTRLIDISSYVSLYRQFELFKRNVTNKLMLNEDETNKKEDILFKNNNRISNNRISINKSNNSKKRLKSVTIINKK